MRAIFMGTPEFAVPSLNALIQVCQLHHGHVVGVICQPDRPAGRGNLLTAPPVKTRALELGLDVLQPTKMRDGSVAHWVRSKNADVAVVVAFGRILPLEILNAPRVGCINIHASILPKYRGAAPIVWAIAHGETETGVSLMQMDEGLDTGPVFQTERLLIEPNETAGDLSVRLAHLASKLIHTSLEMAITGQISSKAQDHAQATLAPILKKEDGLIQWAKPAFEIHNHVRAMQPWPGAFTLLPTGKTLKILKTCKTETPILSSVTRIPGVILSIDRSQIWVACGLHGHEQIGLMLAQPEGKKQMSPPDLLNGRFLAEGTILHSSLKHTS